MTIGIIGTGNVAWHLIHGFQKTSEAHVSWIFSRKKSSLIEYQGISHLDAFDQIATHPVDLILLCVNDDSIQEVLQQLPASANVAYTSGTVSLEKLDFTQTNCGVFYPLQTFTKGKKVDLKQVPFLIESTNEVFSRQLEQLALKLSPNVQRMNSQQRKQLHISAVFTNNFINHLLYIAQTHLSKHQIDERLLQPLLEETIKKAIELGPYDAQSGPARRHDQQTIETHLSELNGITKEIYALISESIKKQYPK